MSDPMDCSMPVFPVLHYLPKFADFFYPIIILLSLDEVSGRPKGGEVRGRKTYVSSGGI